MFSCGASSIQRAKAIQIASPFGRDRWQRLVHRPPVVHNAAGRFGHAERVLVARVQNIPAN
jgi:hypothetical protein